MKESVTAVEKIVDYKFKNKKLLEQALTHSSITFSPSYERLEILGDSALNHAAIKYFFRMNGCNFNQDELSKLRSATTGNLKLARVAVELGLDSYLHHRSPDLDKQVREFTEAVKNGEYDETAIVGHRCKVLADIVESVAAAIYIDMDFDLDKLWMKFKPLLEPIFTLEELQDHPVTKLKHFCEKNGKRFKIKLRLRDEARNVSIVDVFVDDELVAWAARKQQESARHIAAKEALDNLSTMVVVKEGNEAGIGWSFCIKEAKQSLRVLCYKKGLPEPTYSIAKEEGPPHEKRFVYSVDIANSDGELCVRGDEKSTKIAAKNSAAFLMIHALKESNYTINSKEFDCVRSYIIPSVYKLWAIIGIVIGIGVGIGINKDNK